MAVQVTIELRDGTHIHESKSDLAAARVYARESVETGIEYDEDTKYVPATHIRKVVIEA